MTVVSVNFDVNASPFAEMVHELRELVPHLGQAERRLLLDACDNPEGMVKIVPVPTEEGYEVCLYPSEELKRLFEWCKASVVVH